MWLLRPAQSLLLAILVAVILVALSIAFLDRPLATWTHLHTHKEPLFVWLSQLADPLTPLAGLVLAVMALATALGWRPGRAGRVVLACCLALAAAFLIKEQLKYAVGRTWPETWINNNLSWVADGVFSFEPFHGGQGWASFPSGHTVAITAPMAVLWLAWPQGRRIWAGLVAVEVIGLLGANFHWLSDILAGGAIGIASGVTVWRWMTTGVSAPTRRSGQERK